MKPVRIKVECRSGYKANEYPIRFYWNQRCYDIGEIRDRWYQEDRLSGSPTANYYKVFTRENDEFILKYEQDNDCWFLVSKQDRPARFSSN
ncbi:cytoplasmic protein [Gaoshiqia sp. Z1-71]|uniref:cytoplasmic protein n=1 Tax=Gaoshiqia hydrogeniformans TaxID=3290090 RepID=UPI003BF847DB